MDKQGSEGRTNDKKRNRKRRVTPSQLILGGAIVLVLVLFGFSSLPVTAKRSVQQASSRGSDNQISGIKQVASRSAVVNFGDLARQEALNPRPPEQLRIVPEPQEQESPHRSISGKAKVFAEEKVAQAAQSLGPSPPTSASFQGSPGVGNVPPDTQGAAGPNHLMSAMNGELRVQNKSGTTIGVVSSLGDFFSPATNGSSSAFDPQLQYDPYGGRWILVASANPSLSSAVLVIAVSQTSDPTGNWSLYGVAADSAGRYWVDRPQLGFNKNWIIVSANMIPNDNSGVSSRADVFAFNKSNLYSNGSGSSLTRFSVPIEAFPMRPTTTLDSSLNAMYLLQNWLGSSNGTGSLRLYSITGSVGSEVLNNVGTPVFITTTDTWGDYNGINGGGPQLGSAEKIATNAAEIQNVVYRNGSLWCTHTIFLPADGQATRSLVQWWEISPNGTVRQRGRIEDPTGKVFYAFPSIAVNINNDVLIGYARFTATQYAGSGYAFRAASDPLSSMRDDAILKTGENTYRVSDNGFSRWGDYSATVVDPANDTDMWTTQEYAGSVVNKWNTWWGRVTPPVSTLTRMLTVASSNPGSGVSITVSPNDNSNQGNGTTPFTRVYNNNSNVSMTAPAAAGGNNFQKWQRDGLDLATTQSTNVMMDADHTLTAVYVPPTTVQITVQTNPAGRSFTVDGSTYTSAQTLTWTSGSSHTISTTSPQSGGTGTQYVWNGWSDTGGISHTVAPTTNTTYTANLTTQYLLTMNAGAGGTVSSGGYFNTGTGVSVSASPTSGYSFNGWTGVGTGSFSGTSNPAGVTMNGPITETASFTPNTSQASYDPVLKAPKCGQPGSVCNSGTLLNGRSNMTGGAELNQPNTINNSCADGTSGTYHTDESLDAIKVSTLDGTNFAPGKAVRIDVTFWAWSTSSDYLDLFYAADASSPNWIHLLTVQPTATGNQVLTTTYQLPTGGSLQAVRAVFRFGGSVSPCGSNSGYDDHDDLIFAIGSAPQPLQLLLEEFGPSSSQVAALDSVLFLRDPFPVVNGADLLNLGSDRNTRVIIFATNLQLAQGETSSSVVVNLVDSNGLSYDVAAEDVRPVASSNFTQVIFRLPNNLPVGTCTIKLKAHGQVSNAGTIRIRI
jgi:hypothetical protein